VIAGHTRETAPEPGVLTALLAFHGSIYRPVTRLRDAGGDIRPI
jgi:hypothetical protein